MLYLMLLAEPFAIAGALLADPPTARMRLMLERTLLGLVVIQIPLAAFDLAKFGYGSDHIQGTLYGAAAGAHVISAVSVVGAIWILSGGIGYRALGAWRFPVVGGLFVIPFIADAKQVIAALPAIVLASRWRLGRVAFLLRFVLAVGSVIALFALDPAGRVAAVFIENAQSGQGGKTAAASFIWGKLKADPAALSFGKGPAETVSRAAFMTTPDFQNAGSPLAVLGLKPAQIAIEAKATALRVSGGQDAGSQTSFNSGVSSALGVLGDLGIFGSLAYAGLFLSLFLRLRSESSSEGVAAASGFAILLVLGLVFDWWEQPPFGVFLGVLAGLALTQSKNQAVKGTPSQWG
jgi:hypothetical protein